MYQRAQATAVHIIHSTGHLQKSYQATKASASVTTMVADNVMISQADNSVGTTLTAGSQVRQASAALCAADAEPVLQTAVDQLQQQTDYQQKTDLPHSQCSYSTQLLSLDVSLLSPSSAPDAATVQQILTSSSIPQLNRSSCPHLYYDLSLSRTSSNSAGQSQQQGVHQSLAALQQAAALLQDNLPVAIPTETVYGLAGNALSPAAVAAIFKAKGRPADNPLIVHVSDLDMLLQLYPEHHAAGISPIPKQYHRLMAAFWPGPLTILLPTSPLIPAAVTAEQPTMAVRMPAHPAARALIAAAGLPLAAPSANTSGRPSPTTAQHVLQDLHGRVPAVVDGGMCGFGVESTVLDGLRDPPVILRPGGVTAEQLSAAPEMSGLQVYSRDFTDSALEARPTTPGMKYRHYSPSAPVLLLDPSIAWQQLQKNHPGGLSEQDRQPCTKQIQQLMVQETQKILQQLQEQSPCVALLSTCRCAGSADRVGWTLESLQKLQRASSKSHLALNAASLNSNAAGLQSPLSMTGTGTSDTEVRTVSEPTILEYVLGDWQNVETVAHHLFSALRAADGVGCDVLVVQGVVPEGAGLAVMNRLQKAASKRFLIKL